MDFVLGDGEVVVEVKVSSDIAPSDLRGLQAFMEEHTGARAIVVANVDRPRLMQVNQGSVTILPIEIFLQKLWAGGIIS